jgi:integrase
MSTKRKTWQARIVERDAAGKQRVIWWGGRFATKRERDAALARARIERPWEAKPASAMTGDELADRYLARYEERNKASSTDTARLALVRFRRQFGSRAVSSITPIQAEDWAGTVPSTYLPQIVAMFNYAVKLEVVDRNPFAGLGGGRGRGRRDQAPPTEAELEALRAACDVLGDYGPQMRNLLDFAALTLMRPSELFELRWSDIDFTTNRIHVSRRLYRGQVDVPKNGKPKTIALSPPAHAILLDQEQRVGKDGLVFRSKLGCRLTAPTTVQYWALVRVAAGITRDMPIYLASKHYGVSRLYRLGLSARAIAAQAGWSEKAVDDLLEVYGHKELTALAEVDALYANTAAPAVEVER